MEQPPCKTTGFWEDYSAAERNRSFIRAEILVTLFQESCAGVLGKRCKLCYCIWFTFLIVFRCHPVIVGFTRARLLALWPLLLWELTLCYWLHIASLPCVHAYFNWKRRQTSRLLNLVRDDFPFRDGRFSGAFAFELSGNIIKQSQQSFAWGWCPASADSI